MECVTAGTTVVTAATRLARDLSLAYDRAQAGAGARLWEAADILPWSAWLRRSWRNSAPETAGDETVLLSPPQETLLWERVIEESADSSGLLNLSGTAAEARRAYALLHSWGLPLSDPAFDLFEDPAAFQRWARRFERMLEDRRWICEVHLAGALAERVERGSMTPPVRLLHAGFDEITPSQRTLLSALTAAGCKVEELPAIELPRVNAVRVALPDSGEELRAAAQWARARLEASPGVRIAVVVPGLAGVRRAVERIFDDTLHPPGQAVGPDLKGGVFQIAAGLPLTEVPVIAAALRILALGSGRISGADAGLLLRSPFLGGAGREFGSRALLDAEMRARGLAEASLARMARMAEGAAPPGGSAAPWRAPELARRLRALRRALARLRARRGASQWSRVFSRLLRLAGWPGGREPDAAESRAIERWNDLLSDFAALEAVAGPEPYAAALARLRRLAAGATLPSAGEDAAVQILGLPDTAGCAFDHLWITGLEDRAWPAPPRPNPFLPPPMQRRHGLPHSSAERELAYARRLTARLLASAPEVVASYPRREADTDLRPSPLITALPEIPPPVLEPDYMTVLRRGSPGLEELADGSGPPVPGGALQPGGTGVLRQQAACPFRAFAEFRLGARALEEPVAGLSAQERGLILHSALELLWDELRTHAALCAMPDPELASLIRRAVRTAVEKQVRGRGAESMPHLQSLERARLERLLREWLEVERLRLPFRVVASERERLIGMGGLQLKVKVDRVDALDDGRHVIIDYKSGPAQPSEWEGDRPDAPQLPLYAVTHGSDVAAVAFARLAPGECGFKGLGEGAGLPAVKEYSGSARAKASGGALAAHISGWRATLERLAHEFGAGLATVDPKRSSTCKDCPLPALCRIADLPPRMEDEISGEEHDG
ncbi:MAG: PD-(D/E)XK nuclease family protein [Bryobacterales bacterium]|nr:PD-(D/E)XK nuclease family protein [Bryobacterales bacterium]